MRLSKVALITILCAIPLVTNAQKPVQRLSARAALTTKNVPTDSVRSCPISAYLTVNSSALDREALSRLGVKVCLEAGNKMTVRMPVEAIAQLSEVEGVEYIETSTTVQPMMDIARRETGGADMNAGIGLQQPYTGKGVVVGIVDYGFDYTHAAFRDANGNLRIKSVWEQSQSQGQSQSQSPEPFGYGIELTTPDEILNAKADLLNNSHGTHVASAAAGSSLHADGSLRGMASDADIVLVSMTDGGSNNVNISNAIAYIFNYAERNGQPCVINLSLGSHSGPHDGTSTFDRIADELQGPGRLIVGSAGNHRADRFHIHRDFTAYDKGKPLSTFISYIKTPSVSRVGGDVDIWGTESLQTNLVLYKLSTGEEVERAAISLGSEEVQTLSLGRNVTGSFSAKAEVSPLNGKTHILLQSAVTAIRSGYAIAIEVTPQTPCTLDIWADNTSLRLTSNDMEGFAEPTADDATICEIGGTANRILTVGAYTTRAEYKIYGDPNPHQLNETDGDLCSFSSCGPTADGRTKPEVTAPGAFISAAVSQYDNSGTKILSQFFNDGGTETSYGYMQGTSMSSPIVAGIVAAWLQAYPQLTPEQLKEIIRKTSRTDSFTGQIASAGSNLWGYGKIDPVAGVKECQILTGILDIDYGLGFCFGFDLESAAIYTPSGIRVSKENAQAKGGLYIIVTRDGKAARKVIVPPAP